MSMDQGGGLGSKSLCNKTDADLSEYPVNRSSAGVLAKSPLGQRDIRSMFPAARALSETAAILEKDGGYARLDLTVPKGSIQDRCSMAALSKGKGVSWSPEGPDDGTFFEEAATVIPEVGRLGQESTFIVSANGASSMECKDVQCPLFLDEAEQQSKR